MSHLSINLVTITSVALDTELLKSAAGLTFVSANNLNELAAGDFTVNLNNIDINGFLGEIVLSTANDFANLAGIEPAIGFDITEESDFLFSDEDGFTPIEGEIEHTGTVTFSTALGEITVGDFTVGFDAARQTENTSGFFVQNTVEGVLPDDAILFDVGNPEALEISETNLDLDSADLLVAPEFATILTDTGLAAADLTGADVGDVAIDAIF